MYLYSYLTVKSFVESCRSVVAEGNYNLQLLNLMYSVPEKETDYGLSLLRRSIREYERAHSVDPEQSKKEMPFFRNNRRWLVGPEVEMYIRSFYESPELPHAYRECNEPLLRIAFDYSGLGDYCLSENLHLLRCKYEEEKNLQTFSVQMEREYSKFFFDDEHTGFTAGSRFFSLLCNACLEVRPPEFEAEKEWRMVRFFRPAEASYDFSAGGFYSFTSVSLPFSTVKRLKLMNWENDRKTFGVLAGFLQHIGSMPERLLEGLIEED